MGDGQEPAGRFLVTDDGARLWAQTRGAGPHLLLAHGGPGLFDYLGELASALEDVCTVTRFDQRGCGRSTGSDGPFTLARAVADVEAVREATGAESWVLGGHSWGASLALLAAMEHPSRALGVLYIAGVGFDWGRWKLMRRPGPDSPDPETAARFDALLRAHPFNARASQELGGELYGTPHESLLARARELRVPVLVVEGEEDPRPNAAADSMVAALPDIERVTLSGAGHMPWFERRVDFLAAVRGWLGRVSGSS